MDAVIQLQYIVTMCLIILSPFNSAVKIQSKEYREIKLSPLMPISPHKCLSIILVDLKTPKFLFEIKLTFSLHCPKKIWLPTISDHSNMTFYWLRQLTLGNLRIIVFHSGIPKAEIFGRNRIFLLFGFWLQPPKFYSRYSAFGFVVKMTWVYLSIFDIKHVKIFLNFKK